ncbi:uncharacterized protein PAC_06802 [Phialocephala subalpina]|uniref:Heterokaryon incompatibility domain-containing protein n=1 Tax=Phialocephala subalpina TaxID=576137 RepID=A0A1L7WVZ8_9HELO|nr:uncharacterized protein PAC_06802 [Phialocephala subalpina]
MAATKYNIPLLRSFLSVCETNHRVTCGHKPLDGPLTSSAVSRIRVIDVVDMCVVEAKKEERYVALSYVWGQTKQLHLLQSSLARLKTQGALALSDEGLGNQISKTVLDAIVLCRDLGERYLWVDTLCIVQDSPRDKMWQIGRMGRIYGGAVLTIIAAAGEDADAGLSLAKYLGQRSDEHEGSKNLDAEEEFEREMSGCKWDTRGWTFQEKVLSTRMLIFTENTTFFRCNSSLFPSSSQPGSESADPRPQSQPETATLNPNSELEKYTKLVEQYSTRNLSFQSDALKAFSGILGLFATLNQKSNTFTYGLPVAAFDFAFCWSVKSHQPSLRRPEFPSWSWVGWQQEVSYEHVRKEKEGGDRGGGQGGYWYTSDLIRLTHERANGPWASFRSEILLPRSWGEYAHSANIVFEASTAVLRVGRSSATDSADPEASSGDFKVSSTYDESVVYGTINFDKKWREEQCDELKFFVVHAERGDKEVEPVVTILMCYEEKEEKMFRVNTMSCSIPFSRWLLARPKTKLIALW